MKEDTFEKNGIHTYKISCVKKQINKASEELKQMIW